MPKGNSFITALLNLFFNNTTIANLGDATGIVGSTSAGSLYLALHTADPGVSGNQTTNEISYTGYVRKAVARSGTGWTITSQSVAPTSIISFVASSGGAGGTVTHISIGRDSSGTGMILWYGALVPNILVANGVTPQISPTSSIVEA